MKTKQFPPGWDESRVKRVIEHYESQGEDEAVAEDEATLEVPGQTLIEVPSKIVPRVRQLIVEHEREKSS